MVRRGKSKSKSKGKTVSKGRSKSKIKKPFGQKTFDEMSVAELRVVASRYDVPSGGIKKATLVRRLKTKQRKSQVIEKKDVGVVNLPSGESATTAAFESQFQSINIIDHDVEPHQDVVIDDMGEGVYRVRQKTVLGEQEDVLVTMVDNPEGIERKQRYQELEERFGDQLDKIEKKEQKKAKKKIVKQTSQKHVELGKISIYPVTAPLPPKKRKSLEEKQQKKIVKEYRDKSIIPFMFPKGRRDYVPLKWFRGLPEYDAVLEKPPDKELAAKLRKEGKRFFITRGNKVQTQIFTSKQGDPKGRFAGLFTQQDVKPSKDNPSPTIARIKKNGKIYVDNDDTGHFVAYYINMYSFNDPMKKNVFFKGKDQKKPEGADNLRANKFLATSIINTLGLRQNQAIRDVFYEVLGRRSLRYRVEGNPTQLQPSEQILQISRGVYDSMIETNLEVKTLEGTFTFKGQIEEFDEGKPRLYFDSFEKIKARRLDSDLLLRGIVKKFSIEPDSGQALLENLYDREWISYPRVEGGEELEVPVEILKPIDDDPKFNKKFGRQLLLEGKREGFFKGTTQETQILHMIKNAEIAFNNKESFIQSGDWVLQSGDKEWRTDGIWIAGDKKEYSDEEFDIKIGERGISPEDLTVHLIKSNIGTPATRTGQLNRLKTAGVIQLVKGRYLIDTRGLYFVAATQLLEEKDIPLTLPQIRKVKQAIAVNELVGIINDIILVDREKFAQEIKVRGQDLIDAEADLAYLDSF